MSGYTQHRTIDLDSSTNPTKGSFDSETGILTVTYGNTTNLMRIPRSKVMVIQTMKDPVVSVSLPPHVTVRFSMVTYPALMQALTDWFTHGKGKRA